jgi:hypothetical protein
MAGKKKSLESACKIKKFQILHMLISDLRSYRNFDGVRVEMSQFLIAGTMFDQKYFSLQTAICHIAAKFQNPGVSKISP